MLINTKFFGEVEVENNNIIEFPNGLPGFEKHTKFVLLDIDQDSTYHSLQSIEKEEIALVVTNPYLFFSDYEFTLDENNVKSLNINSSEDVIILTVLSLKDPFNKTTANLQAPIVINYKSNTGKQLILNNSHYHTKHQILPSRKDVESDVNS